VSRFARFKVGDAGATVAFSSNKGEEPGESAPVGK